MISEPPPVFAVLTMSRGPLYMIRLCCCHTTAILASLVSTFAQCEWNLHRGTEPQFDVGESAELKCAVRTALQAHRMQTQIILCQQSVCLPRLIRTGQQALYKKQRLESRHQLLQQKHKTSRLQHRITRQDSHTRRFKTQLADHMSKLEQHVKSLSLVVDNKLRSLSSGMLEGQGQLTELRTQLQASTRAQDLLQGLANVITDLRTQLKVLGLLLPLVPSMHGANFALRSVLQESLADAHI